MSKYKIPFDTVARLEADIFAKARSVEEVKQALIDFRLVLKNCGWEEQEYDKIMLARIDKQWD